MVSLELNVHQDDIGTWKKFMNDFNLSVPEFEQFMVKSISKAIASEYVKDIEDSNSESQELEANPVEVENTTEYKLAPSMPQMFDQIIINIEPSVARKFQAQYCTGRPSYMAR